MSINESVFDTVIKINDTIKNSKLNLFKLMTYICVDKHQFECDPYHANWIEIQDTSRNMAKLRYANLADTKYIDVKCVLKKNFIKLS